MNKINISTTALEYFLYVQLKLKLKLQRKATFLKTHSQVKHCSRYITVVSYLQKNDQLTQAMELKFTSSTQKYSQKLKIQV